MAQIKGTLTNKRYWIATEYVDHYSACSYVYLQQDSSRREKLKRKIAFKHYATKQGVTVQSYHADNGQFADNDFLEDIKAQRQAITYCRVNAHHQHGKVEKRIRDLQEKTRVILLHAIHQWPNAITLHLWP